MFPTSQRDPKTYRGGDITSDGERLVISASYPALVPQKVRPFRQYLTDDGLSTGSNDMGIDGSATNVDFYIKAHESDDRYITSLNFIVGYGGSGQPYEWADGPAVTNGFEISYSNNTGSYIIHEGVKSNQDMFRLSFSPIPTGWELRGINANNDYGYFVSMDITKMGLPFGIKLDRGTNQVLKITVRDNLGSAADSFNCIAYGFDRFE